MCDYSLMAVPNRLAVCGEELVAYRFRTGAKGFISNSDARKLVEPVVKFKDFAARFWRLLIGQQCTAVCIPPGAHLLVRNLPDCLQQQCGVEGGMQEVVFTQTSVEIRFRDAVRFANGFELSIQKLNEGLKVRVIALSSDEQSLPFTDTEEELHAPDLPQHLFGLVGRR